MGESLGTDLTTAVGFSDAEWLLTNLYWHQQFDGRRFVLLFGQVVLSPIGRSSGTAVVIGGLRARLHF